MNQWLETHKIVVFATIGALIVIALGIFALRLPTPEPVVIEAPPPTATVGPIKVYVSGAVVHPDVYTVERGSIVKDALAAAGGPAADADLNKINLAQTLNDGQQVYIPRVGEVPTPGPTSSGGGQPAISGPININTATQAELEALPHIGPAIAAKIIAYREKYGPFARIDDIKRVAGIGPSTFDDIKDLITVE
jgi:competence protein ComEA